MNKSPGQAGASFPWGSPHEQIDRDHRTRPRRLGGELRRPGAAGLAEQARGDWIRQQAGGRAAPDVRYAVRRERAAAPGRNRSGGPARLGGPDGSRKPEPTCGKGVATSLSPLLSKAPYGPALRTNKQ